MTRHLLLIVFVIALALPAWGATTFYVAPDGNDIAAGSEEAPFATLERARHVARKAVADGPPEGGVVVAIEGGIYERRETFHLGAEDSGTPEAPTVYRAVGDEPVRLTGGADVPADAFGPIEDETVRERLLPEAQDNVLQADLGALGIRELGDMPVRFRGAPMVLELFFDEQRMQLARWPNDDWVRIEAVIDRGSVPRHGESAGRPGTFQYSGDRPSRWDVDDGVWLNGYWCFDWYDEAIKVRSIDTEQKQITFEKPHHYGVGGRPNRRYYALNILEELDSPGEYYVDRDTQMLYFWPPADLADSRVVVSMMTDPVIAVENASNLTLQGLTIEEVRGNGLTVAGGENVQILACEVRNTGRTGMSVREGQRHRVEACDIHHTGTLGLVLSGGDRKTLTPSHHEAINNHIHHFARRQRTYASGIQVNGVGQRVAFNLLHDSPHQAIGLGGNEHTIEFNEIHHVIMETDDCGAFYMGRNPSHRGTVIRYNFWHHLGSPLGHGNNAVYFDDGDGGQTVYGNVFLRAGEPGRGMGSVFCHGGHDNLVENNIFVECRRAISASPWNDERWAKMVNGDLWQTRLLEEVDITKPPYTTRYPDLIGFMEPGDEERMNTARGNVAVMCGAFIRGNYIDENNFITDEDPGFVDAANGDFALREDSVVYDEIPGFEPIPFERIGLVRSDLRPQLPDRAWDYPPPKPIEAESPAIARPEKAGPPPVFDVARGGDITVDADITAAEWDGADRDSSMVIEQNLSGVAIPPRSYAWLSWTDDALQVAVENETNPDRPIQLTHQWGTSPAVEISVRDPNAGDDAPIIVLRGYPDGTFESSEETGASPEVVRRAEQGTQFAADVADDATWTAEWRIPWTSLGIDPAESPKVAFNITVRKPVNNLWQMWESTLGHSWEVDRAGFIVLKD